MPRNSLTEGMKSRMLELMCSRLGVTVEDLRGGKVDWNRDRSKAVWTVAHEVVGFTETQLGGSLHSYKNRSSHAYRPELEARWRVVAPQWFSAADPDGKKAELKAMALRGEPRPAAQGKNKHPLGRALRDYTHPSSKSYDPVFTAEIKALRPDWFVDTVMLKKTELKAMAMRGEPRPSAGPNNKHPLGRALCNYTHLSSKSYDPVFDREIRALRPDWFVDTVMLKKTELKAMALRGEPRPNQKKHPLGTVLCEYTNPGSNMYDPVFDQEIRALRPDWFARYAKKKEQACPATV
jgi:hypothetical protein